MTFLELLRTYLILGLGVTGVLSIVGGYYLLRELLNEDYKARTDLARDAHREIFLSRYVP